MLRNQTYVYQYNENYFKRVQMKGLVRDKGWEENDHPGAINYHNQDTTEEKKLINNEKNTMRAKKKIFDYAICNDFEHFVTLTFDRMKVDATNIQELFTKIRRKMKTYKARNKDFKYLLIPELHADKKHYHLHGLMSGINAQDIRKHRPLKDGRMRYNWSYWEKHFGFTSLIVLDGNTIQVSKYVTKYMTKEISQQFGQDRYLVSRALKKPQLLFQTGGMEIKSCDFENVYVKIKTYEQYNDLYNDIIT